MKHRAPLSGPTVLIVDHNQDFARNVAELIALRGLQATVTGSCSEALAACREGDYAVAVIDQRLPDGPGTDLLAQIHEITPDTVSVLVTAYASLEHTVEALNQGAFAFVTKDSDPEEILATLGRAVENARLRRENLDLRRLQDAIIAAIPDFLILVDNDLKVQSVHRRHPCFCPQEPSAAVGRPLPEVVAPEVRNQVDWKELVRAVRVGSSPREETVTVRSRDGSPRIFSLLPAPIGRDSNLVMIRIVDLTERLELERRVAETENLAALGRLASSIAHEIRNPVAGIRALTQLLLNHRTPDDPDRENLDEILVLTDRMRATLSDLLNFARPRGEPEQPVSLQDLVDTVLREARRWPAAAERSLAMQKDGDQDLVLSGERQRLHGALSNLVENGLQATEEGGRVEVSLTGEDGEAVLTVEDSGPGLEPDHLERAFQPFFTRKSRGTGLGLYIARNAVEAHGGSIRADRSPRLGGARFTVRLPVQGSGK